MTRDMNVVATGINVAVLMGIFLFLGNAWALEVKPLMHPALDHTDRQPSRAMYQGRPEMKHGRDVAMARMNQIEFQKTIQNLTAPNAFRAQRPVVEPQNRNRTDLTHGGVQ